MGIKNEYINTTRFDHSKRVIVDEIIKRVLPPGAILSHAQNFESGFYGSPDVEEAKKLYSICFQIAERQEKTGNTAGYGVFGYCYEHGYGTEKNLGMARDYYREAAKIFPQYHDDYRRVCEQLYGREMNTKNDFVGLWNTIKMILKNILREKFCHIMKMHG